MLLILLHLFYKIIFLKTYNHMNLNLFFYSIFISSLNYILYKNSHLNYRKDIIIWKRKKLISSL